MENVDISQRIDALIRVMRENGSLKSAAVEQAFRNVPRHLFLPHEPLDQVYQDVRFIVKTAEDGEGISASSQPSIMAEMLEQLDFQPGMRVLEIGAGTGYNAALLADLVGETGSVVSVDIQPDLIEQARANLDKAGFARVQAIAADGGEGYPPGAPYDRIILTTSSWAITPAWREQLREGGRILLPLALVFPNGPQAKSITFERRGEELISLNLVECGFMPLQGAFAAPPPMQIPTGSRNRLVFTGSQSFPVAEQTFSEWLASYGSTKTGAAKTGAATNGAAFATGVKVMAGSLIVHFLTWLAVRSPHGIAKLSATGDAVDELAPLALMRMKGQQKSVDAFLKVQPGGAAVLTRPPEAAIEWFDTEHPEVNAPPQPFEVYVQQLGPSPETAQWLVRMIQAWDAAGRPDTSRLRVRGIPAGAPAQLREGEFLIERPWTNFIAWYQD